MSTVDRGLPTYNLPFAIYYLFPAITAPPVYVHYVYPYKYTEYEWNTGSYFMNDMNKNASSIEIEVEQ